MAGQNITINSAFILWHLLPDAAWYRCYVKNNGRRWIETVDNLTE